MTGKTIEPNGQSGDGTAERESLRSSFWQQGRAGDCPIIDMHGHMGAWSGIYFPKAEPDQMVRIMDRSGVRLLVFSHHDALSLPDIGNEASATAVRRHPDRLRAYCVINPHEPGLAAADMARFDARRDIYVGLKLHATMHGVSYLDDRYKTAFSFADDLRLPVLLHTWDDPRCNAEVVRSLARQYRHATLIMGHSCYPHWEGAAELAREFDHVYLELCAVLQEQNGALDWFAGRAGSEKILYGTDFPWFSHHYYIGGVLAADISDDDRRNIFYRNARRILAGSGLPPQAMNKQAAREDQPDREL